MLLNHGRFNEKARGQQLKQEEIRARRGVVFDRRGRELAVNLELESLYVDPLEVESPKESASRVSALTGRPEKAVLSKFSGNGRFVWVERKIDPAVVQKVREAKISGVGFVPDAKRYYPKGDLAAHLLGFVDVDNRGMEGVELRYNDQLRGQGGTVVFTRDARGRKLSKGVEMESKGRNVLLTIDEGLQYMIEAELEQAVKQWRATAATVIMMDPSNGDILALANRPSYN
ncbi:MAG: penicillin-binding protein, partial [Candidatus Dadabacteria bacterium]